MVSLFGRQFLEAARDSNTALLDWFATYYPAVHYASIETPEGWNALHLAAKEGHTHICLFLINALGFNIDDTDEEDQTPLFLALSGQNWPTARFLFENGADVNHSDLLGITPLHCVAATGTVEMMQLLLSQGADINATSQRGMPLHVAAQNGNQDVLHEILELTGDPHPEISELDLPPLLSAIHVGSIECIDMLLQAGANPNHRSYMLRPLHFAATGQDVGVITLLLEAGANPSSINAVGRRPLEYAAFAGRVDVVNLLFPLTPPIVYFPDWSVNGIMQHAESQEASLAFSVRQKKLARNAERMGEEAANRGKFIDAINWFNVANNAHGAPDDAVVILKKSICGLRCRSGEMALRNAQSCITLDPGWAEAYYVEGAAYMLLKCFDRAARSFFRCLEIKPEQEELKRAHRAALAYAVKFRNWPEPEY